MDSEDLQLCEYPARLDDRNNLESFGYFHALEAPEPA